jgi:hypothetical protein
MAISPRKEFTRMGLFDDYLDPDQFQDSGGILGRLLSLPQLAQLQPGTGFDPQSPETPPDGQTQNMTTSGNIPAPRSGGADVPQAAPPSPDLSDRLSAGFQSWAHTPVGNPFAALANGMAGFNAGQRTDAAGAVPSQTPLPTSAQSPELGDRLSAGFQSWAHTPVGNPFAALANGIAGLSTGQRADPAGIVQKNLQPPATNLANAQRDLNARYQALRPVLGDRNAMLAIVHPEMGQTLIAQALAGQTKPAAPAR